jgi:hypothetical protein
MKKRETLSIDHEGEDEDGEDWGKAPSQGCTPISVNLIQFIFLTPFF